MVAATAIRPDRLLLVLSGSLDHHATSIAAVFRSAFGGHDEEVVHLLQFDGDPAVLFRTLREHRTQPAPFASGFDGSLDAFHASEGNRLDVVEPDDGRPGLQDVEFELDFGSVTVRDLRYAPTRIDRRPLQ